MYRLGRPSDQLHHVWGSAIVYSFGWLSDQWQHAWSTIMYKYELPLLSRGVRYRHYVQTWWSIIMYKFEVWSLQQYAGSMYHQHAQARCTVSVTLEVTVIIFRLDVTVLSGWLSVWMFLGDLGDTDMHKQHDAGQMEMRVCLFISSRDQVTMHRSQQWQQE